MRKQRRVSDVARDKKLGDIVRPFFEKMGAKVEHGPGVVAYTTTAKQWPPRSSFHEEANSARTHISNLSYR